MRNKPQQNHQPSPIEKQKKQKFTRQTQENPPKSNQKAKKKKK